MGTYSFRDNIASITGPGGSFNISGDGVGNSEEGLDFEPADKNNMAIGADGTSQHSLSADDSARLTVRLLKTSPVNALLSSMYATQTISSALHGKNVITVKNPVSGDSHTFTEVAFKKFPSVKYAKEAGINEWTFDCGHALKVLGNGGTVAATAALVLSSV